MSLNELVERINNFNKRLISLDYLQDNMRTNDFVKLLKQLKESKYCIPLNEDFKFNFITLPSWGTNHKQYKINGVAYSHIEKL